MRYSPGHLEDALIATCLLRNPDLLNSRQTRLLREVIVPGFMKIVSERKSGPAMALSTLLRGGCATDWAFPGGPRAARWTETGS
jgi:hypothetical protein